MNKARCIETPVGIIWGRDALFLNDVAFDHNAGTLSLRTGLSANNCTEPPNDRMASCLITLDGVYCMKMTELDCWELPEALRFCEPVDMTPEGYRAAAPRRSCLWELEDSSWIAGMNEIASNDAEDLAVRPRIPGDYRHFVIQTYDDVFEVVALAMEIKIQVSSS